MFHIKENRKNLLIIFLCHILTQGLLLIVSGIWHDDWCSINISSDGLWQLTSELGRPEGYLISMVIENLPPVFYRFLIFTAYYIIAVCFYYISKEILKFSNQEAMFLTLIYLSIPANDFRIQKACTSYTLGLLLFSLSFCILILKYQKLNWGIRIGTLALFFCSFILNSNLVFYGLVLLFIVLKEKKMGAIIKRADYFVLPIAFFTLNRVFFPAHGVYSNYNPVGIKSMLNAVKLIFPADLNITVNIITKLLKPIYSSKGLFCLAAVFVIICARQLRNKALLENGGASAYTDEAKEAIALKEFIIGGIALTAGLFPYIVVRQSYIGTDGFGGRDSILISFGIAMLLDSFLKIVCRKEGKWIFIGLFLISGVIHFNKCYIDYQAEYYWSRGFQEGLKANWDLKECKTGLIVGGGVNGFGEVPWHYTRIFYQFNGMAKEVYGDEGRLFFMMVEGYWEFPEVVIGEGFGRPETIEREWYNMRGYDGTRVGVDAVMIYQNSITPRMALRMRLMEIFGQDISSELCRNGYFEAIYPQDERFAMYAQ